MVDETPRRRSWILLGLKCILGMLALLLVLVVARGFVAFKDRIPGYKLDLKVASDGSAPLRAGFARVKITPDLSDPKRPVWLAGFDQHRAATRVNDDLWATATVIESGSVRIGIVVLDAIGFFNDDVVRVRQRLPADAKLDYVTICSTHNHSTPDIMGLWGPDFRHSGVDPAYLELVRSACVTSLTQAAAALVPARVAFHEIKVNPSGLVSDTRKPIVFDPDIRVMHFTSADDGGTLGSIVSWGDHPETPWGRNTEVTSDFCGYLREALEKGVQVEGQTVAPGLGGIHLYVNGSVGGLMSTTPSVTVTNPYSGKSFQAPSHEKSRALGQQLASRILPRLKDGSAEFTNQVPLTVRAQTISVRLDNKLYLVAGWLGLLDRGYVGWRKLRSEVALIRIGDATIACVPGEIYPEIVNGGIEKAPGGDFQIDPVEVPPIRDMMPGRVKFVFGLANDELGYLIPKSEWDHDPPYLYGADHAPYGEMNSVGCDAAGTIHSALKALCQDLK